jgi:hypothetical protein
MAEAAAEVGVKVGDLDVASMISIQPTEVLEPGKWVEHIDQGILIVAGATCPHGVIVYCARPLPQPAHLPLRLACPQHRPAGPLLRSALLPLPPWDRWTPWH